MDKHYIIRFITLYQIYFYF